MEDYRSKSYHDGRSSQLESYSYSKTDPSNPNPIGLHGLRCYSASYASSSASNNANSEMVHDVKLKKGKSANGSASSKGWSFNDPELQRKKRVASYKVYAVEGKVKGSLRKSFRWLKDRCSQVVYGWR